MMLRSFITSPHEIAASRAVMSLIDGSIRGQQKPDAGLAIYPWQQEEGLPKEPYALLEHYGFIAVDKDFFIQHMG